MLKHENSHAVLTGAGAMVGGGTIGSWAGAFWMFLGNHHTEIASLGVLISSTCAVLGLIITMSRNPNRKTDEPT